MHFADQSLELAKKFNLTVNVIKSHEMRGNVFSYKGAFEPAMDEFFKAIKIAEPFDERYALTSYANVGHVFMKTTNYKKSTKYCDKALNLGKKYKDTAVQITSLNLLGLIAKRKKDPDKALKKFEAGLRLARESRNLKRQSEILYNMSNIYFNKEDYETGFKLFDESMEISKANGNYRSIAIGYHSQAYTYYSLGKLTESEQAGDSALHYAVLSGNYEIIMESLAMMAQIAADKGDYEMGMTYMANAYIYKDSMNFAQVNNAISEAEGKYEGEKKALKAEMKAAEDKRLNDEKLWWRDVILWITGGVLVFVCLGIWMLLKTNKQIKIKNITVERQKEEITQQHEAIKDSIQYAERIQSALIGNQKEWSKLSNEVTIFFKPRDVVSGDFYWVYNNTEKNVSVWAVADCTGHGVPGAFMSMLGIGALNEIVIENGETDPGEILNMLRSRVVSALENEQSESKDGMDIGLCVWDKNKNELSFAGANNGVWLIRDKSKIDPTQFKSVTELPNDNRVVAEIGPDKMPIGQMFAVPPPFSTNKLALEDKDTLVLFTDGYADQFGGPDDKKFKYRPLKELLLSNADSTPADFERELGKVFNDWKGGNAQTDDVCLVTVKVNIV
jgi:serine phosphatase RsbU (regulator of sigma subunit)